MRIKDRSIIIE